MTTGRSVVAVSILVGLVAGFAGCRPPHQVVVGFARQLVAVPPDADEQAMWTACPALPHGCFAVPPACIVSVCSCPRVCQLRGQGFRISETTRVWSPGGTGQCGCTP